MNLEQDLKTALKDMSPRQVEHMIGVVLEAVSKAIWDAWEDVQKERFVFDKMPNGE